MKNYPYQAFDHYVLRTPLLPLSLYKELTNEDQIDIECFKRLYAKNEVIREAIFLASPALHKRLKKWCSNEISDKKENERLTYALLKYISRMCSRCTPFGLFAGTGLGHFAEDTTIELDRYERFSRHTRLDMNYLIALSQNLAKNPVVRQQLHFYPNSSLYWIGNEWRYIEYHYKNNKRVHQVVSLEDTDYLSVVISASEQGALLSELARLLAKDDISIEEASEFIEELVNNQFLISELEPSLSGPEFSTQLMTCLKKLKHIHPLIKTLNLAEEGIQQLDKNLGNDSEEYLRITSSLKTLDTSFELKYMFQTDLVLSLKKNTLSTLVRDKVLKALALLVKVSPPMEETALKQFGKALYERFEKREVSLARALDVESGVGYKQNQGSGDVNPFIDDIIAPMSQKQHFKRLNLTAAQQILHQKLTESIKAGKRVIQLKDTDFENFDLNWEDLSDTLPTMLQLVKEGDQEKIALSGFGGSSAVNLMARFCHGDQYIYEHALEIVEKEEALNPDQMLAEIVHLPEARVGNVLMRPPLRNYEIPYLAKSILPAENQIPIGDLMVSARSDGTVRLRSVSKDKEVIPRLSNAHNFSNGSLPVYHFLADFQIQGKRLPGFGWGFLSELYHHLPRIEYEGIILSKARWTMKKEAIADMISKSPDDQELAKALDRWKEEYQIPHYVLLVESDNELLVNTQNLTSVRMLLNEVKKKKQFKLSEFFHAEDTVVKQGSNSYTNQVLLSFVNTQKRKNTDS